MISNKKPAKPDIRITRSKRRSIALIVHNENHVEIRCPRSTSNKEIKSIINSKLDWIRQQQARIADRIELPDTFAVSPAELTKYKSMLKSRIEKFMTTYDGPLPEGFTIRRQKTRWGSCSSLRNININLKALFLPDDIFEYLMEHELAHLTHMNHNAFFWHYLEQRLPDARIRREKLRNYKIV